MFKPELRMEDNDAVIDGDLRLHVVPPTESKEEEGVRSIQIHILSFGNRMGSGGNGIAGEKVVSNVVSNFRSSNYVSPKKLSCSSRSFLL